MERDNVERDAKAIEQMAKRYFEKTETQESLCKAIYDLQDEQGADYFNSVIRQMGQDNWNVANYDFPSVSLVLGNGLVDRDVQGLRFHASDYTRWSNVFRHGQTTPKHVTCMF